MANSPYIERLRTAIRDLHGCDSTHVESVPVHEVFRGETVWRGDVEVFSLMDHPKAKRCYAWGERKSENDPGAKFIAVLELPPVLSAQDAVRAALLSDARQLKK